MRQAVTILMALLLWLWPVLAQSTLDPTSFIVVGGGWSAGYADFQLTAESQRASFPKLMARQMDTIMPLPSVRQVSNGAVLTSFTPLPNHLPVIGQSGVRGIPFPLFTFNLSVPFITVSDSLRLRPSPAPGDKLLLLYEEDLKLSLANLVLGYPSLVLDEPVAWTQIEYAEKMFPTFVIVELGLGDALSAALSGDSSQLTPAGQFSSDFREVVSRLLRTHANVLLLDVPDPRDLAYFSTIDSVASRFGVDAEELLRRFDLGGADLVTPSGLLEIADALSGRSPDGLSPESVLNGAVASAVGARVAEFNGIVADVASANGLPVFRLSAMADELKSSGAALGPWVLSGEYLGGFYSQDGIFPGKVGHVLLANRLLEFINSAYGVNFPLLNVESEVKAEDFPTAGVATGSPDSRPPNPDRKGWMLKNRGRS